MHPEVKDMPLNFTIYQKLLDMAKAMRLFYYQTYIQKSVTIQNRIGQLVGNLIYYIKTQLQYNQIVLYNSVPNVPHWEPIVPKNQRSSETICENHSNNAKQISDHQVKLKRDICNYEFGYYLAGLIEGVGHFSLKNQQIISFNIKDISQAYYIKKQIGYGTITKIKEKEAIKYVISSKKGIYKVIELINGKMRTESKQNQLIDFVNKQNYEINQLPQDTSSFKNNPWQIGFIDADGSFKIKELNRIKRKQPEIRQVQQIDQKIRQIQDLIKKEFGGSIGHRKTQDTYYYSSVNFVNAYKFLEYFRKYKLQSYKYINYLKWRKVYIIISKNQHRTKIGINKIKTQKG